jgi:hypothetical protein
MGDQNWSVVEVQVLNCLSRKPRFSEFHRPFEAVSTEDDAIGYRPLAPARGCSRVRASAQRWFANASPCNSM